MVTKCADASCSASSGTALTGGYMLGGWMANPRSYSAPFNTLNTIRIANPTTFSSLQLMSGGVDRIDISPNGEIGIKGTLVIGNQDQVASSWQISRDDSGTYEGVYSLVEFNGYLYAGMGNTNNVDGDILVFNGSSWSTSFNSSYDRVLSLAVYNGRLYAGMGYNSGGEGDIYVCDPGSDGVCDAGDWTVSYDEGGGTTYENCNSLAVYNGYLYAGFGYTQIDPIYDGDIKYCNPGADGVCNNADWYSSYDLGSYGSVWSLAAYKGKLYAGFGNAVGNSDILVCTPTLAGVSTIICDDNSDWSISYDGSIKYLFSLTVYNDRLYAGIGGDGEGNGDVVVCEPGPDGDCDTTDWSTSLDTTTYNWVYSLATYNGKLYAGLGYGIGDGDVYVFNGSVWDKSYDGSQEVIYSLAVYNNKLFAGQGYNSTGDGDIYTMTAGRASSYAIKFNANSGTSEKEGSLWFEDSSENGTSGGPGANVGVFKISHSLITTSGAFDIAEDYKATDLSITAGDVVAPSEGSNSSIKKADHAYQNDVLGVVSTKPGMQFSDGTLTEEEKTTIRPVALAGRVPVKVTTENGSIEKGDYLVSASKPGYAMKACGDKYCKAGKVIGIALESFKTTQMGDSYQVREELKDAKKDVNKSVEDIKSTIIEASEEQEAVTEELKKELNAAEDAKKITAVLTKPVSASYGEGRIMMFVNLFWYTPEKDGSTDPVVKHAITGDVRDTSLDGTLPVSDTVKGSAIETLEILNKLVAGEIAVNGNLVVIGNVDISGGLVINKQAIFNSGVEIVGHLTVGSDTAGIAVIPAGSVETEVKFSKPYNSIPIVNATSQNYFGPYTLGDVTNSGFKLRIPQPEEKEIAFYWFVVGLSTY